MAKIKRKKLKEEKWKRERRDFFVKVDTGLDLLIALTGIAYGFFGFYLQTQDVILYNLMVHCADYKGIPEMLSNAPMALGALGGVILLLSLMGFLGNSTTDPILLNIYALLTYLTLSFQILIVLVLYMHVDYVKTELLECLSDKIIKEYEGGGLGYPGKFTYDVDRLQVENECCGFGDRGYQVYEVGLNWDRTGWDKKFMKIPYTCCMFKTTPEAYLPVRGFANQKLELKDPSCPVEPKFNNAYVEKVCALNMVETIPVYNLYLLVIGLLSVSIQLVSCTIARYIGRTIKKKEEALEDEW